MNILFLVLFILILVVYLRFFVQYNLNFEILNIPISKLEPKHLFEKYPIVITEPIVNSHDLLTSIFRYLYIKKVYKPKTIPHIYQQNKCKYLVIYPRQNDLELQIVHPKKSKYLRSLTPDSMKMVEYVEVKLKKRQILILPMHWWYYVNSDNFGRIEIDDLISLTLGRLL